MSVRVSPAIYRYPSISDLSDLHIPLARRFSLSLFALDMDGSNTGRSKALV